MPFGNRDRDPQGIVLLRTVAQVLEELVLANEQDGSSMRPQREALRLPDGGRARVAAQQPGQHVRQVSRERRRCASGDAVGVGHRG